MGLSMPGVLASSEESLRRSWNLGSEDDIEESSSSLSCSWAWGLFYPVSSSEEVRSDPSGPLRQANLDLVNVFLLDWFVTESLLEDDPDDSYS